jgi:hypothetical protein
MYIYRRLRIKLLTQTFGHIALWCAVTVVTVMVTALMCAGQARVTLGDEEATFDGAKVEVRYSEDRGRQGTIHALVDMLDLDTATVIANSNSGSERGDLTIQCKNGENCVTGSVKYTGSIVVSEGEKLNSDPTVAAAILDIDCESVRQCEDFLNALRASIRSKVGRVSDLSKPTIRETQNSSQRASSGSSAKPPPLSDADIFGDILNGISLRNGGPGKNTLDQLGKKPLPASNKPSQESKQFIYVAFAQSAGFDANDKYAYGEDANLNNAITKANTTCAVNANTMCGDEGYCQLRPGLFGAWASDQKYGGAKAFACNLVTQQEAVEQALSWCGSGCKVLWRGGN